MTDRYARDNKRRTRPVVKKPRRCAGCDTNLADPPSDLCPGCQAYKEHTGQI